MALDIDITEAGRFRVQLPAAFTGSFSVRVVDLFGRQVGHREYGSPGQAAGMGPGPPTR